MQKAGTTTGPHVLTSLRNAGKCDKLPIQRSPWVLPVTPSNQRRKLEYCQRQMTILGCSASWAARDTQSFLIVQNEMKIWRQKIEWIKANKL